MIGILVSAQTTQYFNIILDSIPGISSIQSVIKSDSTYFIHFDNILPGTSKQKSYIYRIDQMGNRLDSVMLLPDSNYNTCAFPGTTLLLDDSNHLVIAFGDGTWHYLAKLDQNLDTLWTRSYEHIDSCYGNPGTSVFFTSDAIIQTFDGGYFLVGRYNPGCQNVYSKNFFIKISRHGDLEWVKRYTTVEKVHNIQQTPDSGFVFVNWYNDFHLTKMDKNGVISWEKSLKNGIHYGCGVVALTNDNSVIVASPYCYYFPSGSNQCRLALDISKVNLSTKDVIWNRRYFLYFHFRSFDVHQHFTVRILPDQSIVVAGNSKLHLLQPQEMVVDKGVILKLSSNGDSLWARTLYYGSFYEETQLHDIVLTKDGGFFVVGHYFTNIDGEKAWIAKLDSFGCDTPGCHTVGIQHIQLSNTELQIFPNPTTESLTLQTKDHSSLPEGRLQIFNMQGALQYEQSIPKYQNQLQLNLSHLPSGLYLGRILSSSGDGGGFRFVKE
jgi:hypothetical protein